MCAACHEISQSGAPLIVVGAGLPHLPAVLSAPASPIRSDCSGTSESTGSTATRPTARWCAPAHARGPAFSPDALEALYTATGGYPYFVQAYGKAAWDVAPADPITAEDVAVAAPEAEAKLAVGFFGSRYERATPAEREYLRGMAEVDRGGAPSPAQAIHRRRRVPGRTNRLAVAGAGQPDQEGADLLGGSAAGSRSPCRISAGTCSAATDLGFSRGLGVYEPDYGSIGKSL